MDIRKTDPEYAEILERFMRDEAVNGDEVRLPARLHYLAVLAALMGCGGTEAYRELLPAALDRGLSPVAVKEVVYQATRLSGVRTGSAVPQSDQRGSDRRWGIAPAGGAGDRDAGENRLEQGVQAQAEIFGERMRQAWQAGTVNRWLAENCFGDYYTRRGLSLPERELITFCFLAAQGGCEPQLTAHAKGNMAIGNDAEFLTRVVLNCLPYIGYPRSLNALACVKKAGET